MIGKGFWFIFDGLWSLLSVTGNQTSSSHWRYWAWTRSCSLMSEFQIIQCKLRIPLECCGLGLPVHVIIETDGRTQNATWINFLIVWEGGKRKDAKGCPQPKYCTVHIKWDLNISDYIFSRMSVLTEMQQSVTWPFCDIQCIEITRQRLLFDMLN